MAAGACADSQPCAQLTDFVVSLTGSIFSSRCLQDDRRCSTLLEALLVLRAHSLQLPRPRERLDLPAQGWRGYMRSRSRALQAQLPAALLLPPLLLSELRTRRGAMKRLHYSGWTDSMSSR